jgi:hypothetical protein
MEDFYGSGKNILNVNLSANLNDNIYVYVERLDGYIARVYFTNETHEIPIPSDIKFYKQDEDGKRKLVGVFNNSYFITWSVPSYCMTYKDNDVLELNQHHTIKIKLV